MFSVTRRYHTNDEPEAKNISAWESLISDLSEPDGFDEETTNNSNSLNDNNSSNSDATVSSSGDYDFYPNRLCPSKKKKRASAQKEEEEQGNCFTREVGTPKETSSSDDTITLESPALLNDWILHHSTKYPPHVNHMGRKMSEIYVQIAANIALALARDLKGQQLSVKCEDVVVDNIRVHHCIENGEFKLERVEIIPLISRNDASAAAADGGNQKQTERQLVLALGMVLYELFTQGNSPPARIQQSLKSKAKGNMLSFGAALRISDKLEEEEEEGDNRAVLEGCRRKNTDYGESMNDNHSKEHEEAQESFQRNQRRRRCNDEREESIPTLLKLAGVPSSITRLIADMLSNREDVDFGGLFQYDKSISCIADVIVDLEQMLAKPKDFLFDRIRLSAKPTVRDELYSRQEELRQGMELAEKVAAGKTLNLGEGIDESVKQEVLIVSGLPGSGKSSFVNELTAQLTSNGWESLHCKFDQISRRQPLSTIASAFDRLFLSLLSTGGHTTRSRENDLLRDVRENLSKTFDEESFSILYHLMPNMRQVMTLNVVDGTIDMELTEYIFDHSSLISSKLLVQNLFYELLRVICTSWNSPILFFMDDLHWADVASWELITFLIDEMGSNTEAGTNVLVIGTVRTNEVDNSRELADFLEQIRSSYNVTVTEMTMQDLSPSDVNVMISESLCYSQRLTRSLANIVHQKTTGNCFFIKEFINDLTIENLLVHSFSERTWEWDEDLIESRTISEGVAEILSRKMLRLPKEQLSALVMLSCFGSEVSFEVLALVKSSFGNLNMISTLDSVLKARCIERTDEKYHFVHDMILHAAQEAVDESERVIMMKDLLQALLISEYRDDSILFIIVDLISRVGPERVHDSETRLLYAQLNLTAAEKATQATDFASACTCVKYGISFLPAGHWDIYYRLSLELFSQSALVEWALGRKEEMMKSLDEVFNNAKCFEDTLRAAHVKLNYLRMTGNCLGEAFSYGFQILEHLGETFPAAPDIGMVVKEMLDTKQLLTGSLNASALNSLPELTNSKKKEAMAFLEEILICSYQSQSIHFFLIACRMIHITLQYGMSKYSSMALVSVGLGFVTVFGDFSEGYTMAKTSLSISSSDKRVLNSVMVTAYGMINIWKEPIQATLPQLKGTYDMSVKYGLIDNALASGMLHAYRAFFTGSLLKPLSKEVEVFMRNNSERHKRRLMHLSTLPVSEGIWYLSGSLAPQTVGEFIPEEHMAEAVRNKELTLCECMLAVKMMCFFIFRRLGEIKSTARQYLDLYERNDQASAQFINIYRLFYGGLISLHFYREYQDQFWMDRASHAIKMMELWTAESDWNFENKVFLLQAERHYAFGEMDDATEKYKLAEASSRRHRFVHEEALSCELASTFHKKIGNNDLANELIRKAIKCYQTWGADKKVEMMK